MSNKGLSVNNVVNVDILLSPTAAKKRNFGNLLILGDSDIIDTVERERWYTSLTAIAADLGSSAPEYLAAAVFFAQSPTPEQCYIGRWARTATKGRLMGGVLSAADQTLANFTAVSSGGLTVTVDGTVKNLTAINLSAVVNLNGVASAVQTALAGSATVTWDSNNGRFIVKSATTGASSAVTFATAPGSGTDLSALLKLRSTNGGYLVAGIVAESPVTSIQVHADFSNDWYGVMFAAATQPTDSDHLAVAALIEGISVSRVYGITSQDASTLNSATTSDLASALKALGYSRTFVQYSSSSPYACAGIFGVAFTVDFDGSNTTITLKFKQEAGVTGELLTESQAAALGAKNCNVYVDYDNDTTIIQEGVMASGQFFDVRHGADWTQNSLQTDVYNVLYTSPKVPQTDGGTTRLMTAAAKTLDQGVENGLYAAGVWGGPDIGQLKNGQTLTKGYYLYAPPVASQSQAARNARQSPKIQAAVKLAGAFHSVDIAVNYNQ